MILFLNASSEAPYQEFKKKYEEAISKGQPYIEAISISSYCNKKNEVDSRFVNLKFLDKDEFIFFSNYESAKASQFESHDQISALIHWSKTNTQVRMKAKIKKISKEYSQNYFINRAPEKNALSISSDQSKKIKSYNHVINKYKKVLASQDLKKCPDYWGGFSFVPYYFEFWEGNESRINKREVFVKKANKWSTYFLEP
ncbi:pyridoxamine 5'-phosphate oxidase family protein [Gammaproteobacteria bacterium]|nr:pyridoxamine 5'-phosphate oxidase family protein [Gammaproteobacteria bacterium]